jgi:hypothetical protein
MTPPDDLVLVASPLAALRLRYEAIKRLSARDDAAALEARIRLARDSTAIAELGAAAGAGIAQVLIRLHRTDEAALPTFSGPAYVEFDRVVGEWQRRTTPPTPQADT